MCLCGDEPALPVFAVVWHSAGAPELTRLLYPGLIHGARPARCPELPLFPTCSRVVRKSIARVLTVINQTQKENLRKFYKVRTNIFSKEPFRS